MSVVGSVTDIRITRALGRVVVTPHGAITAQVAPVFGHVLVDLISDQGNLDIVIDARHITAIDAAAAEALEAASACIRRLGGQLEVAAPRPEVRLHLDEHKLLITPNAGV